MRTVDRRRAPSYARRTLASRACRMKRFVLALLLALAFVGTWWWLREDEGQAVELVLARELLAGDRESVV